MRCCGRMSGLGGSPEHGWRASLVLPALLVSTSDPVSPPAARPGTVSDDHRISSCGTGARDAYHAACTPANTREVLCKRCDHKSPSAPPPAQGETQRLLLGVRCAPVACVPTPSPCSEPSISRSWGLVTRRSNLSLVLGVSRALSAPPRRRSPAEERDRTDCAAALVLPAATGWPEVIASQPLPTNTAASTPFSSPARGAQAAVIRAVRTGARGRS